MELVSELQGDVDEAIEILHRVGERCHRKRPVGENPAKDLAARIVQRVPVVYGGTVSARWRRTVSSAT
jgi:hypothetical protein